jgi:hypothetical protein
MCNMITSLHTKMSFDPHPPNKILKIIKKKKKKKKKKK